MPTIILELVIAFVAFYPLATSAFWIAGGLMFRPFDRFGYSRDLSNQGTDFTLSPISILIPAYNEADVIGNSVRAALEVDYPQFEVIVLDDGSTDDTSTVARQAGDGSSRLRITRTDANRGKANQLNKGFKLAQHPLVMVIDADAYLNSDALKMLVVRMRRSPKNAAVAGNPRVANRSSLLARLQALEFTSIIGLIRRTQALGGNVGTVAGIIGLFNRDAVLAAGGYNPHMATEDIDLTYRLLLAGWDTDYEPRALIGMTVPASMSELWKQRRRWARGQGEVLHTYLGEALRLRNTRILLVALESFGSFLWVSLAFLAATLLILDVTVGSPVSTHGLGLAWGIAIAFVTVVQLVVALSLDKRYDHGIWLTFAFAPIYPAAYWLLSALAAIVSESPALLRGPRAEAVRWNTSRNAQAETPT